jgi:septum formation protein
MSLTGPSFWPLRGQFRGKVDKSQARPAASDTLIYEWEGDRLFDVLDAPLLVASTSTRRAEILHTVGWPFETCPVETDESRAPGEEAPAYVERVARGKAEAVCAERPGRIVLGADTVVVVDAQILGKPVDEHDARRMLRLLSGRWHDVLTGVALLRAVDSSGRGREGQMPRTALRRQANAAQPESAGLCVTAHEVTQVRFAPMTGDEIEWYVATGEPMGKAGGYAIQGRAARFIEGITGDYFNVVGLPVRLLYRLLRETGLIGLRS